MPGLVVGTAGFTGKSVHRNADFRVNNTNPDFAGINGRITLTDVHARWQHQGWDLQGLYAKGMIGDAVEINGAINTYNLANPGDERAFVPAEFYGWLVQLAYKIQVCEKATLTPFARYEEFDTQSKISAGLAADPANKDKVTTVGVSFHPHHMVAFKADYQSYADNSDNSRFNLGMGYMF